MRVYDATHRGLALCLRVYSMSCKNRRRCALVTLYSQMTRAVLGDAIALIRGDRFYTTDFTRGY